MSGFEIAGIVLGGFPLLISGLQKWRKVSKSWRHVQRQQQECLRDVQFYQLLFRRNLERLLLPIVDDADAVSSLIREPGSDAWQSKSLAARLEDSLEEAYPHYMLIISGINETVESLQREIGLDNASVQGHLSKLTGDTPHISDASSTSVKAKMDFEMFRIAFSLSGARRKELLNLLKEYNNRLAKLLAATDRFTPVQSITLRNRYTKSTSTLEKTLQEAREKSQLLFNAIQKAWQCPCQGQHLANLRLEHRTAFSQIYFEIILTYASWLSPAAQASNRWHWKEIKCGEMADCPVSTPCPPAALPSVLQNSLRTNNMLPLSRLDKPGLGKQVSFQPVPRYARPVPKIELNDPIESDIKLCQQLGDIGQSECIGIVSHEGETWHLHPGTKRCPQYDPITLDYVLSDQFKGRVSRRERYHIALLLASSVVQLQSTKWLQKGLTKGDIIFFSFFDDEKLGEDRHGNAVLHEPFIRQGFSLSSAAEAVRSEEDNDTKHLRFYSLGILLLELCFGRRLEDHTLHSQLQAAESSSGKVNEWLDLEVAVSWLEEVGDEAGDDFAAAIKWCFTGESLVHESWRRGIIKNVIQPLETCQKHFQTVA